MCFNKKCTKNTQSGCTGTHQYPGRTYFGSMFTLYCHTEYIFWYFLSKLISRILGYKLRIMFILVKNGSIQGTQYHFTQGGMILEFFYKSKYSSFRNMDQHKPCTARLICTQNRPKLSYRGVSHHFGNPTVRSFSLYLIEKFKSFL